MIFRSRARKKHWNSTSAIVLVLGACLLFGLFGRGFIVRGFSSLGNSIYNFFPSLRSAKELSAENQKLRDEMARLQAENVDRNALASENELLRSGFGREEGEKIVYAVVIKRPPGSPYDTFILDAGSNKGIGVGDNVVFGNVLIGSIVESGDGYSKARLLSSQGNTFEGILGADTPVEVKGLGGGAFEAMVPIGTEVSSGDALILPAISPKIFGLVQKIEERSSEGFNRLLFSLPINPNQVSSVGVIIK